jgi:glycosyltransferase involved in cell wall biosynthesis
MLTGIPWRCTAHQFDIFEVNLIREKASTARFVRVISARNRDLVVQHVGNGTSSRCTVVHLGVAVPEQVHAPDDSAVLRMLCPANMVPKKGHAYLLQALAILRRNGVPFDCDLAGDGPLRAAIERQIAKEGLDSHVRLRGVVAHDRLCAELSAGTYDVVVLPSTESPGTFEGIPVALMEAMAAGVPCVSTDTGSISELIENGITSILIPQRDADALASALLELARDPGARRLLGERAREAVQREFDTRQTAKELFTLMYAGGEVR